MKKIGIVAMFTALEGEKGGNRFLFLARKLCSMGYSVELITTDFQHVDKKKRNLSRQAEFDLPYNLTCVSEPGYKKNISIKRIWSHSVLKKNLKEALKRLDDCDLFYISIPPNGTAAVAAKYAHSKGIPLIVDVEDLWPEAMKMIFDVPILNALVYFSFIRDARTVYQLCSGLIGTSDEYRNEIYKYADRDIPMDTVYVGNELQKFDEGISEYSAKIEKKEDEFWVTYAGTIGESYDIKTLIDAMKIIKNMGNDKISAIILGEGPQKESLQSYVKEIECNVYFAGYQPFPQLAAYLSKADVTINSLKGKAAQSIVTKIADYLAAGKPMINTGASPEFKNKVEREDFGLNVDAESPQKLANAIINLYQSPSLCERMGKNARQVAERQFDRDRSYMKIVEMIERLLRNRDGKDKCDYSSI